MTSILSTSAWIEISLRGVEKGVPQVWTTRRKWLLRDPRACFSQVGG